MIDEGLVKSMSIWIWVDDVTYDEKSDTWILNSGELLECSLVSIPGNKDAKFEVQKALGTDGYKLFKSKFLNQNQFTMLKKFKSIEDFFKALIPAFIAKGFKLEDNATDEDVLKAIEDMQSPEEMRKALKKEIETDLTESLTKSITEGIFKKLGVKPTEEGTDEPDSVTKQLTDLKKQFEDEQTKRKNVETELAKLKGTEKKEENSGGDNQFDTVKTFNGARGVVEPKGKSKY